MRAAILILIFLIFPQSGRAECTCSEHKSKLTNKTTKVARVQRSKNIESRGRYKLISYYKDGKLRHKYVDTKPQEVASRLPANHDIINDIKLEPKLEPKLETKPSTPN